MRLKEHEAALQSLMPNADAAQSELLRYELEMCSAAMAQLRACWSWDADGRAVGNGGAGAAKESEEEESEEESGEEESEEEESEEEESEEESSVTPGPAASVSATSAGSSFGFLAATPTVADDAPAAVGSGVLGGGMPPEASTPPGGVNDASVADRIATPTLDGAPEWLRAEARNMLGEAADDDDDDNDDNDDDDDDESGVGGGGSSAGGGSSEGAAPALVPDATPISDGDDDGAAQAEAARSETAAVCDQDEAHGGDAAAAAAGPPSELDRLRREKEVTEDQMQAAVDNDDFDEASRLQEIIDELGDRIEALGG